MLRLLISLIGMCLPQGPKRFLYRRALGWEIDPSARIGFTLLSAPRVTVGAGARIGHFNIVNGGGVVKLEPGAHILMFNVISGCDLIHIGRGAHVQFGNWISGPPSSPALYPASPDRRPEFRLGNYSAVIRGHRIDCSDAVTVGDHVLIAGVQSLLMTHGLDAWDDELRTAPIEVGDHSLLGARVIVQPGAKIAECCVVAPGAVVAGTSSESNQLIGGVPARPIKSMVGAKWFSRSPDVPQ